jgi:hypothetical protein
VSRDDLGPRWVRWHHLGPPGLQPVDVSLFVQEEQGALVDALEPALHFARTLKVSRYSFMNSLPASTWAATAG